MSLLRLGLALLALCVPLCAQAHLLNMTKAQVSVDTEGSVVVELQVDMSRTAGGGLEYYRLSQVREPLADPEVRTLLDRLAGAITLVLGARRIPLAVTAAQLPVAGQEVFLDPLSWLMTQVTLKGVLPVPHGNEERLRGVFGPGFRFEEPIALTFLNVLEDRSMTRWLVTSQASPAFPLSDSGENGESSADETSVRQFIGFGFLHILPKGLDHVLFVLGLYLGARSLKSLLVLVTAFTVAHSITLGLASIGLVRLPANIVEPLISASIVWIGIENFFTSTRTERYRPLLVFAFGLLHGMGFASVLSELDAPQGSFLLSLVSFNIGIELGQLAVIALALAVTVWWQDKAWYRQAITVPASVLIVLVATLWTLQRIFG